ncbi:MAG: hypothetical protein ACKOQY_11365 [Bacteroidota bacterium]
MQVLCAVLLTEDTCILENVPEIRDVIKLIELLGKMGVDTERLAPENSFNCSRITTSSTESRFQVR